MALARIAPLPRDEWTDETLRALGPLAERDPLENLFGTLARHPDLYRRYNVFGAHVLLKTTLADRDRELAILRTGARRNCEYEFAQHTLMARMVGLADEEIERVLDGPDAPGWTAHDAAVLQAVDDLVDTDAIADATWARLAADFSEHQLMDLVFLVGTYSLVCWAVRSFGVELDAHLTTHPWRRSEPALTPDQYTAVARAWVDAMNAHSVEAADALLAPDAVFWSNSGHGDIPREPRLVLLRYEFEVLDEFEWYDVRINPIDGGCLLRMKVRGRTEAGEFDSDMSSVLTIDDSGKVVRVEAYANPLGLEPLGQALQGRMDEIAAVLNPAG